MSIDIKRLELEVEINHYKFNTALGVYHDKQEEKEQRRRIWMLNIIKHKEDGEFLKEMGLQPITETVQETNP